MVNLTMLVRMAQGDGIPLHMAIDMARVYTPFPHAHSPAPLSSTRSPAHTLFRSDSVPRIFWERLAFFLFSLFFSTAQDGFYGPGVFVPST
jgi:hypothetical protein